MEQKKDWWKKSIAVFLMTVIVAYFLSAIMRTLNLSTNLQKNVLQFNKTIDFIIHTDYQTQLIVLVFSITFMVFMITKIGGKKGYQNASDHGVHGTSRWGRVDELKKGGAISDKNTYKENNPFTTLSVEEGIILGKKPNKNELLILPQWTSVDNRNVIVAGSAGSGKTQAVVLNNIINNRKKSIVVTDPKQEIYYATHKIKEDQGFKVILMDFVDLIGTRYNPLDYIDVDDDQKAKQVALTIARNASKDDKEDHWFQKGQELLTGLIVYAKSQNDKASIAKDVKRIFYKASEDENYLLEICDDIGEDHPAYNYLRGASVAKGNERASIFSTCAKFVDVFNSPKVARLTTESDFRFEDLQKEKVIVYVKIPMKNNPYESLTATFFDQLITVLYRVADENHGELPIKTLFLLDEFANIGKINDYQGTLSTCRSLGIEFITILQDLAQLESKYGKENARTIISNHDSKLFLRTGDIETAKYFEELAGETTVRMKTSSNSQSGGVFTNGSASKSSQEQYVKRPLITKGELLNIDRNKCYLFVSGYYPLELEKAYQYKIYGDLLFKGKNNPNYDNYRTKYLRFLEKHSEQSNVDISLDNKQILESHSKNVINEQEDEQDNDVFSSRTEQIQGRKDEIKNNNQTDKDNQFTLFAKDFLMNNFDIQQLQQHVATTSENEIQGVTQSSMYDDIDIDAKETLKELFSDSEVITKDEIEEGEELTEELEIYYDVVQDPSKATEQFLNFINEADIKTSLDEDEEMLKGEFI